MKKLFFVLAIALLSCLVAASWPPGEHPNTENSFGENFKSFSPQLISVQGLLVNATTGAPVDNGVYSMNFSIWDAATGGNMLWAEVQSVQVSNGYFDALLGATGATGFNCFIGAPGADLFTAMACAQSMSSDNLTRLEIKIGSEVLSPRYNMTVAPFAFTADYATVTLQQVTALGNWTTNGLNSTVADITAVYGNSVNSMGVQGISGNSIGVSGEAGVTDTWQIGVYGSGYYGLFGQGNSTDASASGVYGTGFKGVEGTGNIFDPAGIGVYGTGYAGVKGETFALGVYGVLGNSDNAAGYGVYGNSSFGTGVYGWSAGANKVGVYGNTSNGIGVKGEVAQTQLGRYGVLGVGSIGVNGTSTNSSAQVFGDPNSYAIGVYGSAYPGFYQTAQCGGGAIPPGPGCVYHYGTGVIGTAFVGVIGNGNFTDGGAGVIASGFTGVSAEGNSTDVSGIGVSASGYTGVSAGGQSYGVQATANETLGGTGVYGSGRIGVGGTTQGDGAGYPLGSYGVKGNTVADVSDNDGVDFNSSGVYGESLPGAPNGVGVQGKGYYGIVGSTDSAAPVQGLTAIFGSNNPNNWYQAGVLGVSNHSQFLSFGDGGVLGIDYGTYGNGVAGISNAPMVAGFAPYAEIRGAGVFGNNTNNSGVGVLGRGGLVGVVGAVRDAEPLQIDAPIGVWGIASPQMYGLAVLGQNTYEGGGGGPAYGVYGYANDTYSEAYGVYGIGYYGLYGESPNGYALYADGNASVTGNLTVGGSTTTIDGKSIYVNAPSSADSSLRLRYHDTLIGPPITQRSSDIILNVSDYQQASINGQWAYNIFGIGSGSGGALYLNDKVGGLIQFGSVSEYVNLSAANATLFVNASSSGVITQSSAVYGEGYYGLEGKGEYGVYGHIKSSTSTNYAAILGYSQGQGAGVLAVSTLGTAVNGSSGGASGGWFATSNAPGSVNYALQAIHSKANAKNKAIYANGTVQVENGSVNVTNGDVNVTGDVNVDGDVGVVNGNVTVEGFKVYSYSTCYWKSGAGASPYVLSCNAGSHVVSGGTSCQGFGSVNASLYVAGNWFCSCTGSGVTMCNVYCCAD